MAWVTITGAGTTTATRFKGDATNKIDDMFNGVDVSDTVKIHKNVTWSFVDDSLRIQNPADTFSYIFTPSAILANRVITIPLLTGNEELVTTDVVQTLKSKKLTDTSTIVNNADVTKSLIWSLSGDSASTSTTLTFAQTANRVITFPNATDTLVGKATSDVFYYKSYDCNGTGNVLTNVGNAEIESHTSTKITITDKNLLNVNIAYIDQTNVFGDFNQDFLDDRLRIQNPAATFYYTLTAGAITGNKILNIPVVTNTTDTLAVLGLAQTFTGLNSILVASSGLTIRNPADTFKYTITGDAILSDRILNLPLTTATDTLAVLGLQQTFTAGPIFSTVAAQFRSSMLTLRNPANTFSYTVVPAAIVAARNLNLPLITGTDTLAVLGLAQTFTAVQTMSGLNVIEHANTGLTIRNPANTFDYTLAGGAIVAARTLNLPVTTATDTIAVLGFQQTFTAGPIFSTVAAQFKSSMITVRNPADTFSYTIVGSAIVAARNLTLPLLTASDTVTVLAEAQTFLTGAKTFNSSILKLRNPADTFSYTFAGAAITADRIVTMPLLTQGETLAVVPQTAQSSPSDPTGTTSTVGVMMGLAGAITPRVTGKIFVVISGSISNDTATDGAQVQLRHGTGTAPTNAAALTGTTGGGLVKFTQALAGQEQQFSSQYIVSGLTVGTAYWLDVGLAAITAGTANIYDVSLTAYEL